MKTSFQNYGPKNLVVTSTNNFTQNASKISKIEYLNPLHVHFGPKSCAESGGRIFGHPTAQSRHTPFVLVNFSKPGIVRPWLPTSKWRESELRVRYGAMVWSIGKADYMERSDSMPKFSHILKIRQKMSFQAKWGEEGHTVVTIHWVGVENFCRNVFRVPRWKIFPALREPR